MLQECSPVSSLTLEEVTKLFENWRQNKPRRKSIPPTLWQAAVSLSSTYNVVKAGTNAQVTLKKDSDTLFLFASTETGNEKKYQVTITSSTGAGLDNAGNEWDMDSGQGGTQRKAVLKFQLSSSGNFLKWDGSAGGPEVVITNNWLKRVFIAFCPGCKSR